MVPYGRGMEARIIRGMPPITLGGKPLWQLETRLRFQSEWARLYGHGRTSTDPNDLRKEVRDQGWILIEDAAQDFKRGG